MARFALIVFVSFVVFITSANTSAEEVERAADIRAAVDAFSRAFVEADVQTLALFLSENYIHVNGGSGNVLDRDDWLNWVEFRRSEIESEILIVDDYRIEDVRIMLNGDTATVVGTAISSVSRKGVSSTSRIRFSNTWIFLEHRWVRAAFHDSPLP